MPSGCGDLTSNTRAAVASAAKAAHTMRARSQHLSAAPPKKLSILTPNPSSPKLRTRTREGPISLGSAFARPDRRGRPSLQNPKAQANPTNPGRNDPQFRSSGCESSRPCSSKQSQNMRSPTQSRAARRRPTQQDPRFCPSAPRPRSTQPKGQAAYALAASGASRARTLRLTFWIAASACRS
jgi:hypothetical protein